MAKIVSSYCTKVVGENKIFKETIRIYRDALSLLIRIVDAEWDSGLGAIYALSTLKARRVVELLIHSSRTSTPKYPEFDKRFYKYPSYLRRASIPRHLVLYLRTAQLFLAGKRLVEKEKPPSSRLCVPRCRPSTETTCTKITVMGLRC